MADKSMILSAEAEAALLKPIDEYVGKIQKQIDALRVEGSDKVNSLKNQIAIAKEKKGRICVERESYSRDYEIKFYHYTKSGSLSKTATYVGFYIWINDTDEEIKEKLKNTFSLAL